MEALNVYLQNRLAGVLEAAAGQLSFRYDPAYLSDPDAVPISYSMPLRAEPFDSPTTTVFFENLLPPDEVRKRLGKILHLSRYNIFGFLKAIGGDCAGAIATYAPGTEPGNSGEPKFRELSEMEASEILSELPRRPLNLGAEEGFRISGTGAQDKLIACVAEGRISLPLYGTPSTHIIKPLIPAYPTSVFNEYFCMRLAGLVGIRAPHCEILTVAGKPYYCVSRYDRQIESGKTVRLHQEDFCQLLSVDPETKYEAEGGPTVSQCFALIRKMRLGAAGQLDFIRRIAFNYLIGNGDAHAKNSSVLYRGKRAELAPVYDLLSTEVYPALSHESAMKIGGDAEFSKISRDSFTRLALDCGIRPQAVLDRLDKLSAEIPSSGRQLAEDLNRAHPSPVYAEILKVIEMQIGNIRLLKLD